MSVSRSTKTLFRIFGPADRRPARPARLGLDRLEAREVPAVQVVAPDPLSMTVAAGKPVTFAVMYETNDPDNKNLGGVGVRVHYDSTNLALTSVSNVLTTSIFANPSEGPQQNLADAANKDSDAATDKVVFGQWLDITGAAFPGFSGTTKEPIRLFDVTFTPTGALTDGQSLVRVSGDAATNQTFQAGGPFTLTVSPPAANKIPEPVNDTATTQTGTAVTVAVLANDTDPDNGPSPLSVSGTSKAANGTVAVSGKNVVYTPNAGFTGTDSFTYTVFDGAGSANGTVTVTVTAQPVGPPLGKQTAVGPGPGGGARVEVGNQDGTEAYSLDSFSDGSPGGVRVASADFNRDGTLDIVVGTGPGRATLVRVIDGKTKAELFSIAPFEASFTGGVYVAAGDLNGDGTPDLVITPDEGGGPRCSIFDGANKFARVNDFFGIDDVNFRGGARAAIGDVNGDGAGDLIVAAGFLGGPRVAGFSGKSVFGSGTPVKIFGDFFAFEQTLRNGVFMAAGDLDGDGKAEVIAGGGPGGGPRVTAFRATDLLATNSLVQAANFFGGNPDNRGGIRLAVKDLDNDTRADLVVGAGEQAGSRVTAYLGKNISATGSPPEAFGVDAFPSFNNGVFVG